MVTVDLARKTDVEGESVTQANPRCSNQVLFLTFF